MKNMLFILNPSAGRKHIKSKLFDIVDIFVKGGYNEIRKLNMDATELSNLSWRYLPIE